MGGKTNIWIGRSWLTQMFYKINGHRDLLRGAPTTNSTQGGTLVFIEES